MSATALPATNLPTFLTTFIGRGKELADVKQQLTAARLLTLTGSGGCGKTRLALEAAAQLLPEYGDGAWWCDLAAVTDPAHITPTLASVLRLTLPTELPVLDSLVETLRHRRALLILDNCEHLLAGCAALSLAVLQACPGVRILATSLQPLGLPQEHVWPVPPMSLPDTADDRSSQPNEPDAVRLFVDRAVRVWRSFELTPQNRPAVIAICRRLDGQPLALELAAARVRLLAVEQIAANLDDAFGLLTRGSLSSLARHQTLRLAIDWSYQFLLEGERRLLLHLAVFAGPFSLSMVAAVCGDGLSATAVLNPLDSLASKSFVFVIPRDASDEPQFRLLEVVRQYARARLEDSGEAANVRNRYLDWCIAWAEHATQQLTGAERGAWLAAFEARQEHFRAALRWACTSLRAEAGLRLAGALGRFWLTSSLAEGSAWFEELLAVEASARAPAAPAAVRAQALLYSGRLAVRQGDALLGLRRGEESLALFRAAADGAGTMAALNVLALAAQDANYFERAETCYGEALAMSRRAGEMRMTAVLLVNQGLMYYEQQDYRRAAPIWHEAYALIDRLNDHSIASRDNLACLAMMQGESGLAEELLERELARLGEAGDPFALSILMMDMGELARRRGDFDRAQAFLTQALERQQQIGDRYRSGETLCNLGSLARNRGQWEAAKGYYEQSLARLESATYTRLLSQAKTGLALVEAAHGRTQQALALFREGLRLAQRCRHQLGCIEALEGMAGVVASQGETHQAARWLATTKAARQELGAPIPQVEREGLELLDQQLRAALGDEVWFALRVEASDPVLAQLRAEAAGAADGQVPSVAAGAQAAPSLRVLALGPTQVLVGERSLASADWTYVKSKELLFYLLERGPATKAQIGLDLWPEASPNQLRAAFHSALHHLRRALGRPAWITHAEGQYTFNFELPSEYDAASFDAYLRQARAASRTSALSASRADAIGHLEAAAALWRGEYLADLEAGDWALYRRETLRQAFLDCLLQLGELHFAEAHYYAAGEAFRQALHLDGYLELAHRGLMRCYARQGEAGQAVRHYKHLRQTLDSELSTAPSSETTLLYERIRRGDDI